MKNLGIIELRNKIKSGEITSEQITKEYISAIKESKTNAVVEVFEDAVDVAVSACLGCSAKFVTDGEFITNVIIDDVDASAVKDALMFYREMNA